MTSRTMISPPASMVPRPAGPLRIVGSRTSAAALLRRDALTLDHLTCLAESLPA
jgi:hypothetical protein